MMDVGLSTSNVLSINWCEVASLKLLVPATRRAYCLNGPAFPCGKAEVSLVDFSHDQQPERQSKPVLTLPKRKVILLKPLQDSPDSLSDCKLQPIRLSRTDCDTTDNSSVLDFSPTSVLPKQRHEYGSGTTGVLSKALQKRDRDTTTGSSEVNTHHEAGSTPRKQLGSWACRQVVHDLSQHPLGPCSLPGASSPDSTALIDIRQQPKLQQAQVPKADPRSTLEAAWRWKFKRQWGKEQLHHHFPDSHYVDEAGIDPWHDALCMIQAENRTAAAGVPISDHDCYAEASASPLLDDDDLDGLLELDTLSTGARPAVCEMVRTASSQALAEAAAKARDLRKCQVGFNLMTHNT